MSAKLLQFCCQITFLWELRIMKRVEILMKVIKDLKLALRGTNNKITTNEIALQIWLIALDLETRSMSLL